MIPLSTIQDDASQIAGQRVEIVCDSPATEGGHVLFDGWIHLTPTVCYRLQHPASNAAGFGQAALLLEHESTHIDLDTGNEALVECTAISNVWQTIRLFHLPAAYVARALAAALAFHHSMPAPYQDAC